MVLKVELETLGHVVLVPNPEPEGVPEHSYSEMMRDDGTPSLARTHELWDWKRRAILNHFRKIDESDAVLVTNFEKNSVENYIGANTFLEMGYAYGTGKRIFVLNALPEHSPFMEEILGMQPTVLGGNIAMVEL